MCDYSVLQKPQIYFKWEVGGCSNPSRARILNFCILSTQPEFKGCLSLVSGSSSKAAISSKGFLWHFFNVASMVVSCCQSSMVFLQGSGFISWFAGCSSVSFNVRVMHWGFFADPMMTSGARIFCLLAAGSHFL